MGGVLDAMIRGIPWPGEVVVGDCGTEAIASDVYAAIIPVRNLLKDGFVEVDDFFKERELTALPRLLERMLRPKSS